MKLIFTILFFALAFSASAQWYRVDQLIKKKVIRTPVEQLNDRYIARFSAEEFPHLKIHAISFAPTEYSVDAAENVVMKEAQHNMRFRIYADASYNFSELARLYMLQSRFSEAKWYLLQSNNISRQQNDDKHTVANLVALADIKLAIGDFDLAQQDLEEAHDIAWSRGFNDDLARISQKMIVLKQNTPPNARMGLNIAAYPQNNTKAE